MADGGSRCKSSKDCVDIVVSRVRKLLDQIYRSRCTNPQCGKILTLLDEIPDLVHTVQDTQTALNRLHSFVHITCDNSLLKESAFLGRTMGVISCK